MPFLSNVNLTHRATTAVVSSLWNQDHIIADIENILFGKPICKQWTEIEKNVLYSLKKLELPAELKLNLENFVQPMGMQIRNWITLTISTFQGYPHLSRPIMFVWTEKGSLDHCKVTKLIIQDNSDKISLCFCLACIFCIEEIILNFWPDVSNILTERIKKDPLSIDFIFLSYWAYYLNGEVEKLMTLTEYCGARNAHEFAFLFTLDKKCISALNYFLRQIHPEKRRRLILLALQNILQVKGKYTCDGNLVLFLFSHLKESDVNQIKSENSYAILVSFLVWPCQEYFMPTAIASWQYMSNPEYLNLLQDIVEYVSIYFIGNLYKNLIEQFWKITPSSFKEYVISKCISGTFLSRVFQHENTDNIIQMIFHDCNPSEKQQMIFHFEGMNICDLLVRKERWQSLKLFIKNCISTDAILNKFIEQYKNYKPYYYNKETELRIAILIEKIKEWY